MKNWLIKNFLRKIYLFGTLISACEDEILNTTEISLVDKKVRCKKTFLFCLKKILLTLFHW